MNYPEDFPEHLKNRVEAALSGAEIDFATQRKEAATWEPIQIEVLIKRYIRRVMFIFADAACTAVEARIWTGEKFRQAFNEYQYGLTEYVWVKKHPRPFDKSSMIDLRLAALTQIEESREWIAIQERLKLAAQSPKSRFKALREQTESLLAKSSVPSEGPPEPAGHPSVLEEKLDETSDKNRLARLTSLLAHLGDQDHFATVKSDEPNGKISSIHWAAIESFLTRTVQYLGASMKFSFSDDPIAVRSHIRTVRALLEDEIHRISPSQLDEQSRPYSTHKSGRSTSTQGLSSDGPIELKAQSEERELLRRSYFEHFANSEKIVILDFCWAAKQHYRDWTRWLQGEKAKRPIKNGHKADRAFRVILASKKRPEEYRAELRPPKWQ